MRVLKNAPTANIRAYMRENLIYADVRIAVRQEKWRMAIPNRDGTVSAKGLYIGMHWFLA